MKETLKKYWMTIAKYAFAIILSFVTMKTTKDIRYVLVSLVELLAIFTLSDVLVRRSKWFNILNGILMFVFNAELIMLLFGHSFITFVMVQNLASVEDLKGKAFIYGLGVLLVVIFSVLPIKPIEKIKKISLFSFPVFIIADILLIVFTSISMSPYAGARDLYSQWADYRQMKKTVSEYKAQMDAANANGENSEYSGAYDYESYDYSGFTYKASGDTATNDSGTASGENVNDNTSETVSSNGSASDNTVASVSSDDISSENGSGDGAPVSNQPVSKLDSKLAKQYPVGTAIEHNTLPQNTNVIIIFVEGLSNNVIMDPSDIMPNLRAFRNESITFSNYYNHTFATYRGIQGQLYSGYSLDDFESNRMPSLIDVLNAIGYNTVMINVEPYNSDFTRYLKAMRFGKVISDKGESDNVEGCLSDGQAYRMLFETAKTYQSKGKPFCICLYSFGTHVSFDSEENQFGDGSNNFLNRYYNCDVQIGEFIDNFKSSSLSKDTLLIITADHAAYADEDFTKTFPGYVRKHGSCDQIPLYIYYHGITMNLNAGGRNSLDLAPTILDLLGYDSPATFVGRSLYSPKNETTVLDSFFWNPDGVAYTGDGSISAPKKDMKDYVNGEVIKYVSAK